MFRGILVIIKPKEGGGVTWVLGDLLEAEEYDQRLKKCEHGSRMLEMINPRICCLSPLLANSVILTQQLLLFTFGCVGSCDSPGGSAVPREERRRSHPPVWHLLKYFVRLKLKPSLKWGDPSSQQSTVYWVPTGWFCTALFFNWHGKVSLSKPINVPPPAGVVQCGGG